MARRCELKRVADQVNEDLAEARRVGVKQCGRVCFNRGSELQPFGFRQLTKQAYHSCDDDAQVEVDRINLNLPGFDPCEVQDLIDESEQGIGAVVNAFDEM